MITGQIKNQVDQIWSTFWPGGANPLSVIEQITYLLFAKWLDEFQTAKVQANSLRETIINPIFMGNQADLRWPRFKDFEPQEKFRMFRYEAFPCKSLVCLYMIAGHFFANR